MSVVLIFIHISPLGIKFVKECLHGNIKIIIFCVQTYTVSKDLKHKSQNVDYFFFLLTLIKNIYIETSK